MGVRIEVDCPKCKTVYKISPSAEGNLLKCKKCRFVIDLTKASSSRSATGRKSKSGTGRHAAGGGGKRPRKGPDMIPAVMICGLVLFIALIVFLIKVSGGGDSGPAAAPPIPDSPKKAEAQDPPPAEQPKDPVAGTEQPEKQPEKPPEKKPDEDKVAERRDPPRDDPPPPEEPKKLGVRKLSVPDKISADDQKKLKNLFADIRSGDPINQERARDNLRGYSKVIAPLVLNELATLDFENEEDRHAASYLGDVLNSFRGAAEPFDFRAPAFAETPNVGQMKRIREECFDWWDTVGSKQ